MKSSDDGYTSNSSRWRRLGLKSACALFVFGTFYVWLVQLAFFYWDTSGWFSRGIFATHCVGQIVIILFFAKRSVAFCLFLIGLAISATEVILKFLERNLTDSGMFLYEVPLQGILYATTFCLLYILLRKPDHLTITDHDLSRKSIVIR